MKTIFITGISSGIGKATAVAFLNRGDCVIGTVRDENSVTDLKEKYKKQFFILKIDLKNFDAISNIDQFLIQNKINHIDVLINNAGIAIAAPFQYQNFLEVSEIINLNVLSLMKVTQVLIPYVQKSIDGRVINISSVSGINGTPFLAVYCAAKYAVEGFSEALRRELHLLKIKVIIVGPGSIQTPIWDKGFEKIKSLYDSTPFKKSFQKFISFAMNEKQNALPANDVVKDILHASLSQNPKIRYAPVPRPFRNKILPLFFTKKMQDRIYFKSLGL